MAYIKTLYGVYFNIVWRIFQHCMAYISTLYGAHFEIYLSKYMLNIVYCLTSIDDLLSTIHICYISK